MAEVGALVLLHHLGSYGPTAVEWEDIGRWLAETPSEDVLVALVRVAALALAWWLAASTILYAVARVTRVPSLVGAVEWATLPAVRRLVDGLAVTTIAAGSVLGTSGVAAAAPADDTAVVVQLGTDGTSATTAPRYRPRPAGDGNVHRPTAAKSPWTDTPAQALVPPASAEDRSLPTNTPKPPSSAAIYAVQPGDNLWTIAERHLAKVTGKSDHELAPGEVRRYWLYVTDHNRALLRSGDPDLIYAGEQLTVPSPAGP